MANVELKPARVFEQFAKINAIPRPSKHEEKMIEYLKAFGQERGLETKVDETGNVIIRKPATPGMEERAAVILQSHMDMVCAQTEDCPKDMTREGLDLATDGRYVWAEKTSLGGDDCIAVAAAFAILADNSLSHPPLEVVITVDEETGMDPAKAGAYIAAVALRDGNRHPLYAIRFDYKFFTFLAKVLPARFLNWLIYCLYGK